MVKFFRTQLENNDREHDAEYRDLLHQDIRVTQLIQAIYQMQDSLRNRKPSFQPMVQWPRVTPDLIDEVVDQLQTDISIYGNGGVFAEFETEFKRLHKRPEWHALLHNSGTNALQALYYASAFKPGDEVIFPVYTFHATSTPAMIFGAKVVFCDVDEYGNLSAAALSKLISNNTRAVVVTHMWGTPCDMPAIQSVMQRFPQALLLEDCSHAHGASIGGQLVGTFGDGAAWSLQGQKLITGGEGGICLTKHADFHYRQLIWGHYNKRCKVEIPKDHELYGYFLTGASSKNRAHPIAVRIALHMLRHFPAIQRQQDLFAKKLSKGLAGIKWLELPPLDTYATTQVKPAWYAFVIRFDKKSAPPGLTREAFVERLQKESLVDVDIPGSTKPLHKEPLYTAPWVVLPHAYQPNDKRVEAPSEFPAADSFYGSMLKIPVWAYADEEPKVDRYINVFLRVAAECSQKKRKSAGEGRNTAKKAR